MRFFGFMQVAALGMAMSATPGFAGAITVFGNSSAVSCYQSAEAGRTNAGALQDCGKALDEPLSRINRAATHVNRGIIYMHLNEHERALTDYNRALELIPDLGEALVNRGIATWHRGGDMGAALSDISRGLNLGTTDPAVAYFMRGLVNEELGRVADAYADYSQAAALMPDWDAPRRELSRFRVAG